ncbi:MAG: trypsin-like peptidase domain-containing protein, partial [Rhodospirillaceae bacterium]
MIAQNCHRRMTAVHGLLVGLAAGLFWPLPAQAFDAAVLDSVVAVIPQWPGAPQAGTGVRDAPEGSAVAVLPGGYLATNAHVLGRATAADIRFADGRVAAVEIVGRDARADIALLKADRDFPVPAHAAPPAPGGRVCAVGNQFGLGLSVTCGVVSALGVTHAGFNRVEDFIQTDAAVNPGGSGGALVDDGGRLIGLVSAIFTKQSDANIGVNFATVWAMVRRAAVDLRDHGRVQVGDPGLFAGPLGVEDRR